MIEVKHLTKKYGDFTAVSDLNFSIETGCIYGFLGPNGAGKSTTMNIMTGCLAATEGNVIIEGHDIFEEDMEAKKLIGYLPELPPLYLDSTPNEYLKFVAEAKGVAKEDIPAQIDRVVELTGLQDYRKRLIKHLSKGYRQRVGIAQAILGNPSVIILDEPTVGLDPMQIIEIRDLIKKLGEDHTVILSSHILSEVQAVCDTVMIISHGKLVACDKPDNLEKLFADANTVELTVEAGVQEAEAIIASVEGITSSSSEADGEGRTRLVLRTELKDEGDDQLCRDLFFAFAKAGKAILQMTSAKASLEDVFIELTTKPEAPAEENAESGAAAIADKLAGPAEAKEAHN